jgi:hypothetical protein
MNPTLTIPLGIRSARLAFDNRVRSQPAVGMRWPVFYAAWVALVVSVAVVGQERGFEFGYFSSDPNRIAGAPFYAGGISNLGVLLWWAAATAALLAGAVLRRSPHPPRATPLLLTAAGLSAVLAIDDLYMVHELVAPYYLGVPQKVMLAGYAVGAAVWAFAFRRLIIARDPAMIGCAIGLFALSIVLDQLNLSNLLWEDGAKLVGVAGWCGWLCRHSYLEAASAVVHSAGMRRPGGDPQFVARVVGKPIDDIEADDILDGLVEVA